jgi:micrococcal nuclease
MKPVNLLLLFVTTLSFAQEKVSLENIAQYEGKTVTICEKVQSTFLSNKANTSMLNFGKAYPNQTFVVIIFEKDLVNFNYVPTEFLKEKTVCITGKVILYKGMPEIIVTDEKNIVVQ